MGLPVLRLWACRTRPVNHNAASRLRKTVENRLQTNRPGRSTCLGVDSVMALPAQVKFVVIGAGIHGLSSAWNLAENLRKSGRGSGQDILVLDKTGIAAGASGIACGVVRNNYFQPAMRRLMAHSVSVWESDEKAFSYHPVGYMQISPEVMHGNVATIYQQQKDIGYESVF